MRIRRILFSMNFKNLFKIQMLLFIVILICNQSCFAINSFTNNSNLRISLDGEEESSMWYLGVISDGVTMKKDLLIYNDSPEIVNITITPTSNELFIEPMDSFQISPYQNIHRTLQWNPIGKEIGKNFGHVEIMSGKEKIKIYYDYWFEPKDFSVSLSLKEITVKINDKYVLLPDGNLNLLGSLNYIVEGRMYAELRFFIEFLGFQVSEGFNFSDSSMVFVRKGKKYYFKYLADQILIDNKPMKTHKLHIIRGKSMYLPIRLIADLIGYTISWDPKEQRVTLYHHH
jgi:hypothetical protein